MPQRFGLTYVDRDGQHKQPVMIHRAIMGSVERFIGILVEHYAGAFPLWLAPVQARVISIADDHVRYASGDQGQAGRGRLSGWRLDDRNEKIGYKIREAQVQKMPYMLVVGGKEAESGTVAVRHRRARGLGRHVARGPAPAHAAGNRDIRPRLKLRTHIPFDGLTDGRVILTSAFWQAEAVPASHLATPAGCWQGFVGGRCFSVAARDGSMTEIDPASGCHGAPAFLLSGQCFGGDREISRDLRVNAPDPRARSAGHR